MTRKHRAFMASSGQGVQHVLHGLRQWINARTTVVPALRPSRNDAPPAYPALEFELASYTGKIRALSTVWFLFAAAFAVLGFMGMAFANAAFHGRFWWMHGSMPRSGWAAPFCTLRG